ncbi:hypothetical protein FRB91_008285, partial [Serendipita sp. 411]
MPLDVINGVKDSKAQASSQTSKPVLQSRILAIKRMWDDEFGSDTSASQKISWSPSPDCPPRPPKQEPKVNNQDLFRSAEQAKQVLTSNTTSLLAARARFRSNAEKSMNQIKVARSETPLQPTVASLPAKRKAEIMELSDSEDERIPKRRQSDTPDLPPAIKSVKPWDQDHTKMKLPVSTQPEGATKPKAKAPELFSLSSQQRAIHDIVVQEGKNVFFTGSAGTGKSVLLRSIIKSLRAKYVKSPDAIAITASTGIAACNIGGVTVHSFGGFGLGNDTPSHLAAKIKRNQKAHSRWTRTKVLIIDE